MKMPKIPTWGWALLVLAVFYYVFMREGMAVKKKPSTTAVANTATA
jgi:hypothetical protein